MEKAIPSKNTTAPHKYLRLNYKAIPASVNGIHAMT